MANPNFVPNFSSNEIFRDLDTSRCLTDDLDAIEQDIAGLESGKAASDHTHTGYASANHTHNEYAASDHTHTGYASAEHEHAGYAATNHEHTGYAAVEHTHTGYAASDHTHSGYAAANHAHSGYASTDALNELAEEVERKASAEHTHAQYAAASHTHTGYAASNHAHTEYATADHAHTGYAAANHTHDYAASNHTHTPASIGAAPASHTHDYAASGHTHTPASIGAAAASHTHTVDSALSSTSTNPVQNKVVNSALAGKANSTHTHSEYAAASHTHNYAASSHTHSEYFSANGGTINGETNVAGVLRVQGQQAFYYATGTSSQTVGTNNATGGTTICCGASADVAVNGANLKAPNVLPRSNNTYYCGNTNFRWKGIYSTAAVNVSSDERLKRNIEQLDGEALAKFVEALKVVSYNYKDDEENAKSRIGLVAQDVQKADAELSKFFVDEDEEGMLGLTPADLVFPLIAAVQQLSKRVQELENK